MNIYEIDNINGHLKNFIFVATYKIKNIFYIQYHLDTFTYDFILLYFHVFNDR